MSGSGEALSGICRHNGHQTLSCLHLGCALPGTNQPCLQKLLQRLAAICAQLVSPQSLYWCPACKSCCLSEDVDRLRPSRPVDPRPCILQTWPLDSGLDVLIQACKLPGHAVHEQQVSPVPAVARQKMQCLGRLGHRPHLRREAVAPPAAVGGPRKVCWKGAAGRLPAQAAACDVGRRYMFCEHGRQCKRCRLAPIAVGLWRHSLSFQGLKLAASLNSPTCADSLELTGMRSLRPAEDRMQGADGCVP